MPKREADKRNYSNNRDIRKSKMVIHYRECKSKVLLQRKCAYYYKSAQVTAATKLVKRARKCVYAKNCDNKTITNTCNLSLHEPNQLTRELYAKRMKLTISRDGSLRKELIDALEQATNA